MKEMPAECSHHMPKPEVSVSYLPSPSPSKCSAFYQSPHEGLFSHFKVCFKRHSLAAEESNAKVPFIFEVT